MAIPRRLPAARPPPAFPVDFRRGNEQAEWDRIAKDWNREECRSKRVALRPGPQPLQNLLHNRPAGREAKKIFLPDATSWLRRQEFNPYGSVNQNRLGRRRRGRSSRIWARSPFQRPDPKKCGMLWIFRTRITSSRAVFTAAEYVLAAKTSVACMSRRSSSTRFVRHMCINWHPTGCGAAEPHRPE